MWQSTSVTGPASLRERKKQATRAALQAAALRLALEHGPDHVRVEDIAEAAGVSPRTYNNYFSSREQAIVAAIGADRAGQVAAAVATRPAQVSLADAVFDAVVGLYSTEPSTESPIEAREQARAALLMIASSSALRSCYVDTVSAIEGPLTEALVERCPDLEPLTAQVLSASVGAATRVALRQWLTSTPALPSIPGFVIPAGSLPDLLRAALRPLAPALNAAAQPGREGSPRP